MTTDSTEETNAADKVTYRLYEEADLPQILRLWEAESGWGAITPEQWRKWYVETPHGACLVVVGVDEQGEVAAQEVFTPSRLYIDGQEVSALRLSVPILRKDLRRDSIRKVDHPVVELYMTGIKAAIRQGYEVVYALPEHAWLPFFRWTPRVGLPTFEIAEYDCVARDLTTSDSAVTVARPGFSTRLVENFGDDYEKLWRTAAENFPVACGVVRGAAWLRYKNGGHVTIEVRDTRDASLAGYVALRKRDGLVSDFLARRPADVTSVLAAAIDFLVNLRDEVTGTPQTLKLMQTPALADAAGELGFTPTDYKFAFVCTGLGASVSREAIDVRRWHIMPGD